MNFTLRELKDISRKAYENLSWELNPVANNPTFSIFRKVNNLREITEKLHETELFEELTSKIINSTLFSQAGDSVRLPSTEATDLNQTLVILDKTLKSFSDVLDQTLPDEDPSSINIKLPPVNDFNDLSLFAKDFHLALTQVIYLDEINGNLKIDSVENGSIWLNVIIYGSGTIGVIGSLVWSAAVIYKKILEGKMMEQQLKALTLRTESMNDVVEAQRQSLNQLIQAEAELISSTAFKKNVPENIERIKGSIKLLADLLDKGAEIHPAIGAPEEVTNLYPNMKNLPTIESKTKRLSA